MQSLLVTSESNLKTAKKLFKNCAIHVIRKPPSEVPDHFNGKVIGFGGGSVIDTAKLIANPNPCYAIPTTASGAAVTSHAVIWRKDKVDIRTPVPILDSIWQNITVNLNKKSLDRTKVDCFCHIIESTHSKKSNEGSRFNCHQAEAYFMQYLMNGDMRFLIEAGNWAGRAIEITGTNFIHAISYVLTLDYGYCHGDALKQALDIWQFKDCRKVIEKAKRKYPKFYESTLI